MEKRPERPFPSPPPDGALLCLMIQSIQDGTASNNTVRRKSCSLREHIAASSQTLSQMHRSWEDNARKPMRYLRATMNSSLNKTGSGDGMECS